MFDERSRPLIYRPAMLPDDRRILLYPLLVLVTASIAGYVADILPLMVLPLLVLAIFPGIPIVIHGIYHLTVRISLEHGAVMVVDHAGDPLVSCPRRQRIQVSRISYVYHLSREAEAAIGKSPPAAPFGNSRIRHKKYVTADDDPRRTGAVARSNNGLVLSDKEGHEKIYLMHFHDLAMTDWQHFARQLRKQNEHISVLMSEKEQKGFFG